MVCLQCDPYPSASEASFSHWGAIQIYLPFTFICCMVFVMVNLYIKFDVRSVTHSADTEGSQNFKTWSRFYAKIEFCIFLKKIKIKIRKRPICINFFHMLFACKVRNNWDLMYDLCYAGFTFSYGHKWAKSFVTVLVTAETDCSLKTDCSLTVPVMAVSGKTTSSQSLYKMTIKMLIAFVI